MKNENSIHQNFLKAPLRGLGVKEAIILAGGLGTRLRDAVPDLPKCMAPVAGRPFLFYVINYLRSQGIEKFIFSLGYRHEVIKDYLNDQFSTLNYECTIEDEPLGTGGAILLSCIKATEENVLITNGDTIFKIDVDKLAAVHFENSADATLALKPMTDFDRYGIVEINKENAITNFKEKQFCKQGNINGGTYLLNVKSFLKTKWPLKFSFEKDFLEIQQFKLFGSVQDEYFIDIGIPEDYNKVQIEFAKPQLDLKKIDNSWTLFLDRDGVINEDKIGSYIFNADEFIFMEGVPEMFKKLTELFHYIIVVTNQRGVGKELMTMTDLANIHNKMNRAIEEAGGSIDAIYYAPSLNNKDLLRKPNPGMAFTAKKDFPDIDLSKSILVGNKLSDMQMGKNAGMYTVFVATTNPETAFPHPDIDYRFDSLLDFVKAL